MNNDNLFAEHFRFICAKILKYRIHFNTERHHKEALLSFNQNYVYLYLLNYV